MKSSERRCHALTIFENVHGAKMEKGMYTNLYTEIWDSMIFRDMVNKCTMNTKPAKPLSPLCIFSDYLKTMQKI